MNKAVESFISYVLAQKVLKFGEFKLKSGRLSPYFFNLGEIQSGQSLRQLGDFYAQRIEKEVIDNKLSFDLLLGPAYKGIPLVSSIAISMYSQFGKDTKYAFNRKEAKTHGEKGLFVGSPPKGNILLVDDVITAGTAVDEIMMLLKNTPDAKVIGLMVAFDRQEMAVDQKISTVEAISQKYQIPIYSLFGFHDLLDYINKNKNIDAALLDQMLAYRDKFGAK